MPKSINSMFVSVILLAAGRGERFRSRTPKTLAQVNQRPLITFSLRAFCASPLINEIVVVVNQANRRAIESIDASKKFSKIARIVLGGKERQDSVACGLKAISPEASLVVIHDAARPFVSAQLIGSLIREARLTGAAIAGVPVKATIKKVGPCAGNRRYCVQKTLVRQELWEIQTPQVFEAGLIRKAYQRFGEACVTDDAALVEKLKARVSVVEGSYCNIKITTPEDLVMAEAIAKGQFS